MPIVYHEKSKEFHLYNKEVSYLFQIIDNGQLGQLYYGKRLRDREDFSHLFERCSRDMAPYNFEGNCDFSLEHIKTGIPDVWEMAICGIRLMKLKELTGAGL